MAIRTLGNMFPMRNLANKYRPVFLTVMIMLGFASRPASSQSELACRAPVKWRIAPKFTDSDIAKWKHKAMTGTVSLVVSESGDVIQANIVSVKPNEAARAFLSAVQEGKFQPRPGCGEWKINLTLHLRPD